MTIVTWNCNGALRHKYHSLAVLDADILIIQVCENPIESNDEEYREWAKNHLWIGDSKNKGLGIFAFGDLTLEALRWPSIFKGNQVKHFLPCRVNDHFNLLAVWTHKNNSPTFVYIGQFWKYLQLNKEQFNEIVIAGDFNSNAQWHQPDRWWNHLDVVRELQEMDISSVYHRENDVQHGKESQATFYLQRNLEKPFHLDYIFASENWIQSISKVEIGSEEDWLQLSDHMPITASFQKLIS